MAEDIYELLVSDITEKYLPVYPDGDSWQATVEYLYSNERELMDILFETFQEEGIRRPIVLTEDDDDDPRVMDGTHRVAIALYHGLVTLPARYGHEEYDSDERYMVAKVELIDGLDLSRPEDDKLIDKLRSWKLNSEIWVNVDGVIGALFHWELFLSVSDMRLKKKLETRILSILKATLPDRAFSVTVELQELMDEED